LFKSNNNGGSWTTIANTNVKANSLIHQICPTTDPNIIYFSTNTKLFKTSNGGVSWSQLGGLPNLWITDIATLETDPNTVWVTYSGTSSGNKVYKSTNGGSSWSNMTGSGLPNVL
jgi:photosystem II stability/assembly factor-like uncharacterized protein